MTINVDSNINRDPILSSPLGGDLEVTGTGQIRGTGGQTGFVVAAAGTVQITPGTNSTTAFNVTNAAATSVISVDTTNARVGIGTTGPAFKLDVQVADTATNTVSYPLQLGHALSSGTAANGIGSGLILEAQNSTGTMSDAAYISAILTDAVAANGLDSVLTFSTRAAGAALQEQVRIDNSGNVGIGTTVPATLLELEKVTTLTSASADGYSAALTLDPGYTAASAVTRHNYIDVQNVSLASSASVVDAAVLRFDADYDSHLALSGSTAKASASSVSAWMKCNIAGSIFHTPLYRSTTA